MHRSMSTSSRSSIFAVVGLCAAVGFGCPSSGVGGDGSGGGNGSGSGGRLGGGTGGGSSFGSGGSSVGPGSGGSGVGPGTGGSGVGPGSGGRIGGTGGGGVNPGTGGGVNPGTGGGAAGGSMAGNRPAACAVASADVISDFEENSGVMVAQGTPLRTGWWYTYYPGSPSPLMAGMMQTPARSDGPIAVAVDPMATNAACNKALHVTGSGFTVPMTGNFSGFGASFLPAGGTSQLKSPYNLSAYTGISFKIRAGSGTPPAVYFEVLTKESQPTTSGGNLNPANPGPDATIGLYNSRGQLLNSPWNPLGITGTWQTVTVPFSTLVPRWMPAGFGGGAMSCAATATAKCQAPKFTAADVLAIQFSMYADPGFPMVGTLGTYDLWIDDVTLVRADAGIQTRAGFPLAGAGTVGPNCTKPTGADGKFLVPAYNFWKSTFAPGGTTVIRPESGNDTVSEGIAYGMLIAVNMNDKALFDSLYAYWKAHKGAGNGTAGLMTWCIPAGGGSCNPSGGGSATDADEDAAFALLQAGKVFGATPYTADAMGLIADIWALDIDHATMLPKGGSNYTGTNGGGQLNNTNASYFAPAYYRAFTAAGDTNPWAGVVTAVYNVIGGGLAGANGLFPAWCSGNCSAAAQNNGGTADTMYQYDSHRIPWRIGLDYCFNGGATAQAYLAKTSGFFQTQAAMGTAKVLDIYNPANGQAGGTVAPNSSSILGTAAVGAMSAATFATFRDDAFQSVLDQLNRATMAPKDTAGLTPYSYFNATVGMLTLLTMTGNFHM